jgi:hypothetical protein
VKLKTNEPTLGIHRRRQHSMSFACDTPPSKKSRETVESDSNMDKEGETSEAEGEYVSI